MISATSSACCSHSQPKISTRSRDNFWNFSKKRQNTFLTPRPAYSSWHSSVASDNCKKMSPGCTHYIWGWCGPCETSREEASVPRRRGRALAGGAPEVEGLGAHGFVRRDGDLPPPEELSVGWGGWGRPVRIDVGTIRLSIILGSQWAMLGGA